jgi:hypothetical protein
LWECPTRLSLGGGAAPARASAPPPPLGAALPGVQIKYIVDLTSPSMVPLMIP